MILLVKIMWDFEKYEMFKHLAEEGQSHIKDFYIILVLLTLLAIGLYFYLISRV